jgi:hypothetical protein
LESIVAADDEDDFICECFHDEKVIWASRPCFPDMGKIPGLRRVTGNRALGIELVRRTAGITVPVYAPPQI